VSSTAPFVDFRPESPFRPLDWRYRLARDLAAGTLEPYLTRFADNTVRAAASALNGEQHDAAATGALALMNGPPLDVAELEARVIGGQTDAEIGAAMNLPAATVTASIDIFFDVRGLLTCRSRLRAIAAGGIDSRAPTPEEAIRWAGFRFDGPWAGKVAEYFRRGFGDGRRITGTPGLDADACKQFRSIRNWLSSLDPDKDPAVVIFRWLAFQKKDLHERRRQAAGGRAA
jgi:hypothetical protein